MVMMMSHRFDYDADESLTRSTTHFAVTGVASGFYHTLMATRETTGIPAH